MKILILADEECKSRWDYFDRSKLAGVDLVLSCGDLSPQYLSFIATFTSAPVLYVHGNHDGCYEKTPPEGCLCIENQIYVHNGVRILGLGGSMRYKDGPHQFSQKEMKKRARKMWFSLHRHKGFDILLAHSPAYKINDSDDLPHMGFEAFVDLMDEYSPSYFIHGHVHATYGGKYKRISQYKDTTIINGFQQYLLEVDETKLGQPKRS